MIARVATDTSLDRTFDYSIPEELLSDAQPGMRVRVSFGNRIIIGTVVSLAETSDYPNLKPLLGIMGEEPFLAPEMLKLARWISAYYLAPIGLTINAFLPAAVRRPGGMAARTRLVVELVPEEERPLPEPELTARQREVFEIIERTGDRFMSGICRQWHVSPDLLRRLESLGMVRITSREERRSPLERRQILPTQPLQLSESQTKALKLILEEAASPRPRPVLLHGVTASGKTEVYLQAIAAILSQGRGAIVLVPEIALTPQTIQRFAGRFGEEVAVLHSQMADGERHDEWYRIKSGDARVVVGPRSAVFAPVCNLGIIIVDEEHEPSYKQEETPRYHARDVAVVRAGIESCAVVLGSATPSLESWHNVTLHKYVLASMPERIPGAQPPRTLVVDMRQDSLQEGRGGGGLVFSQVLVESVRRRLELGEQTMLFLNRRGYAPTLTCQACGHVETCPDCSVAMTLHLRDQVLRCHLCSHFCRPPAVCKECQSPDLQHQGIGTQRIESIARKIFPGANIERMDADVTIRKHSHDEILARFRSGKIDILIGTQMIAKGLDFPNVTLVGIMNADAGLFIPDFRASERTFQLIAQMSGRSGRGTTEGEVLVQTSHPSHPAITFARTENYASFAEGELKERQQLLFPPFSRLVCVTFRSADENSAQRYATGFVRRLKQIVPGNTIVGEAAPAPMERIKTRYRFQTLIRTTGLKELLLALRHILRGYPQPKDLQSAIDIDAISLL